jgi:MSHA biogenesis protein MshN
MLKDLDQRQEGAREQVPANQANLQGQPTAKRNFGIAIFIIVLLNIAAWFVWQMYQENQSLKQQTNQLAIVPKLELVQTTPSSVPGAPIQPIDKEEEVVSRPVKSNTIDNETAQMQLANAFVDKEVETTVKAEEQKSVAVKSAVVVEEKIAENGKTTSITNNQELALPLVEKVVQKPSISIKSRQLSAEELARKNYKQAQQALNAGDVKNAEKWFEEVLLLTPDNDQARKELAALWFGKQDFSAAHNLLSQGLSRDYNNSQFRLMKARIYIKQGQLKQAMLTLAVLKDFADVEYQSLLASTAQQIEAYDQAIYAYQKLTILENSNGKWWLGLAIGFDKQSQFEQAVEAYTNAVSGHSLSINAIEFAQSRIRALGE